MMEMPCRPLNIESFGYQMFILSQQFTLFGYLNYTTVFLGTQSSSGVCRNPLHCSKWLFTFLSVILLANRRFNSLWVILKGTEKAPTCVFIFCSVLNGIWVPSEKEGCVIGRL